jgi:competence protein ComGC
MKKIAIVVLVVLLLLLTAIPTLAQANEQACWGQASAVFAQMGVMGQHSSAQPTPRLGLRNLARALYQEGVIEDDSMQALGRFVVEVLGLEIEACMQ